MSNVYVRCTVKALSYEHLLRAPDSEMLGKTWISFEHQGKHTPPPAVIRNRGDKKSSTQKPRENYRFDRQI